MSGIKQSVCLCSACLCLQFTRQLVTCGCGRWKTGSLKLWRGRGEDYAMCRRLVSRVFTPCRVGGHRPRPSASRRRHWKGKEGLFQPKILVVKWGPIIINSWPEWSSTLFWPSLLSALLISQTSDLRYHSDLPSGKSERQEKASKEERTKERAIALRGDRTG